ncbi:MAG: anthranilate synthase component I [Candidatus Sumerlaeia bacterium]|nr:anthranilate synthase component I [Candidatus Sumerlaeia bacterium]
MITPSYAEFERLSKKGNLIALKREILADLETPVSVFRKFPESGSRFLLESVENGEQLGRFSFIGANPFLSFKAHGGVQTITTEHEELRVPLAANPMDTFRALMAQFHPVQDSTLPPFSGGAVGLMSYDSVRFFEAIPNSNADDLGIPELYFLIADSLVAFDHVKRRMLLIVNAWVRKGGDLRRTYDQAVKKLNRLYETVCGRDPERPDPTASKIQLKLKTDVQVVTSNIGEERFLEAAAKAKEYIGIGDIFQVVLSQRLTTELQCDPFDLYRALRAVNPSPYMFFLDCEDFKLAGSSPEILVRSRHGKVELRPIAGTRPRGATPEEDVELEKDLLADEKEVAEHIMLVDLGRNDVGRVAQYGSVKVTDLQVIERYSHVMHIVSNVEGKLADNKDAFDVLAASFPAGTLTGAPKIRAMEIIDELEPTRRGSYGGSVVYIDFSGNMDSCIVIRTALIKDGLVHVQAGAGIVADSVPEKEWEETLNKARGVLRAVEWANSGLE